MDYNSFLKKKIKLRELQGFKPLWIPDFLFDFQKSLCEWSILTGRGALFEECGMGKTPQELVFAENVVRKTNKNVLILTPLAVAPQFIREAEKFGIEAKRTKEGKVYKGINITNYQRLHYYNPKDFTAVILDESSILKNVDGKTRKAITKFMEGVPYRLLATATPAPNDFMELGTSSEALGIMGRNQMLGMFFINGGETTQQWQLKGHAKRRFWQWMASWARALRKPSDLGFNDDGFILPKLSIIPHVLKTNNTNGFFPKMAYTLSDQRKEKRKTIEERCEKVADVLCKNKYSLIWCHLNQEGDLLTKLIPDAVQVKGSDSDDEKEERLTDFSLKKIKVLVTKPKIACFGLNWQHCSEITYFPENSHEMFYQAIRRCWRFGQMNPVNVHIIHTEAEMAIMNNMIRKERQAEEMYSGIIKEMLNAQNINKEDLQEIVPELPKWI